ncbi:MAG: EamA family transporter [Cyclobacteriaceae bacterium]|nr:EamA family transporter [Cyclobacteriaceae bacterium]
MKENKNLLAYLALAAVCVIWGTTYLGLRIGVTQFPPFLFSIFRFLTAGPILILLVALSRKAAWPDRTVLFNQAVSGFFMVTLGISVVGWAEMYISSGVAAIICSMMPIWTVLINVFVTKDEQPNWLILLGLATGLTGVVMIFGEHLSEFSNSNYTTGIVLTFAANLSWAIGSIWIKKKNTASNPFFNAGLQMLFGGLFLIPFSLLLDDYGRIQWNESVIYSLVYMSLVGSVAAYACYSYAIKKLPMTLVSLYAYINPIVAVLLGWLVLNEKLNLRIALAIVVTVAGIYIVNKGYQLKVFKKPQPTN